VTGDTAHWQAVLDAYQAVRRLPGVVAVVHEDARPVWTGVAGEADPELQYRIGSITKSLTAIAVMQCRDDGLIDLDEAVGRTIPETAMSALSLRQLLSHTSGIRSEPAGPWWERSPGVGFADLMAANGELSEPFAPGETFHYSNLGFALLGEVIARVRGASWFEVLQERVLGPLGMARTTLLPVEGHHAQGWSVDHFAGTLTREPHQDTRAMAPAGQLWSTAADLGLFVDFLARGDDRVLADASREEMLRPVEDGYGLGIMVHPALSGGPGNELVGHSGSMPGFQACALIEHRSGRGLVALTNATTGFTAEELAARMLGSRTPPALERWRPSADVPAWARELLGLWFWGNSAFGCRWHNERLEFVDLARSSVAEQFVSTDGRIVGHLGYHQGETLEVRRGGDGAPISLECATFVYTRTPYDPRVEIPGGHPAG